MEKIFKGIILIILTFTSLVVITIAWNFYYIGVMKWTFDKSIVINKGEKIDSIIDKIKGGNKLGVKSFLKISGIWNKLKPGNYELHGDYTLKEIYERIASGKSQGVKFVIPEGYTLKMVIKNAEEKGLAKDGEFREALKNYDGFYYPHPEGNYEGYMYPATYSFYQGMPINEIVDTILKKFLEEFPPDEYSDKDDFYNKLIMSSIIEKEAYHSEEKKIIASVFYNRLKLDKRLESCATVEYLYDYSKEKLYYKNLKIESPYNTYMNKGMPPAPICNPSKESFEASANPANTDYLYFVAMEDRHHIFTKTYEEHLKAQKSLISNNIN